MRILIQTLAISLLLASTSAVSPSLMAGPDQPADQPGDFPHDIHLEQEMVCADCHVNASSMTSATEDARPSVEVCLDCHDEDGIEIKSISWGPKPEAQTIRQEISRGLIFSHEAHMDRTSNCEYCHLEEDTMTGKVQLPSMGKCMQCHEGRRGLDDCSICHSVVGILRPSDHHFTWISHHREEARQDDGSCLACHNADYCQECHEGGRTLAAREPPTDRLLPYGPQVAGDETMVQRAHDLNYRFTHSLDAEGKESECAVCHQRETFCSDCHASGEDPSQFRPAWHGRSDWGAIPGAVGTGGGSHAEMARRDIEMCAACHEVSLTGTDPACLTCHRDLSLGRGNDPSTHDPGFAGDVGDGEWHDDPGALCYVCHTRSQAAGDAGFCGYCHGEHD